MTAHTGDRLGGLTAAIQAGDNFAFEEAFRQFREKLYAYFLFKTANREDARDLVQNCFVRLWQYRKSISTEFLLEQQLFHIARTVLIDHLRRESKRAKIRSMNPQDLGPGVSADPAAELECRDELERALASGPENRKKVFYLNRVQGYSYREIADLLSISVKSADNQLTKAVRHLKKVIALALFFLIH